MIGVPLKHSAHSFRSNVHELVSAFRVPESTQLSPLELQTTEEPAKLATFDAEVLLAHVVLKSLANF